MYYKNKKLQYFSIVFISLVSILKIIFDIYFFQISLNKSILYTSLLLLPIGIMYVLRKYLLIKKKTINANSTLLFEFIVVFIIQELIILFIQFSGIRLNNVNSFIIQIILMIVLLLVYNYLRLKLKTEKIHLNLNCSSFFISMIIGVVFLCLTRLQSRVYGKIDIFQMIINFIFLFFYPALYEEFLYRGFIIGGMKKFKLDDEWINIIQALVFGLVHYNQFSQYGVLGILGTSTQILVGFLLGKMYYYTGSLTPCIIIHAFFNLMFL